MDESLTISWRAFEHHHRHHSSDWYWALGIVTVSVALIALLFSDVLLSAVVLLAGVAIGLVASRPPGEMSFEINERGVVAHREFFSFKDMRAFWIADDQFGEPHLFIDTPRVMTPDIIIPIPDDYQDEIRGMLLHAEVIEREMSEPLPHRILEFFGF
jgi:hypothetical protein